MGKKPSWIRMAPSHGLLWNERIKEPRGLKFLFSAAWHWPMPELLLAATPWLPWWTEASKQNKPLSPESSMTDILFQQGENGYSGSPRFTNAEKHKSRKRDQRVLQQKWQSQDWVSIWHSTLHALWSCSSLRKLWEPGCLQEIKCTYTDFTLHFNLFYLGLSRAMCELVYTLSQRSLGI